MLVCIYTHSPSSPSRPCFLPCAHLVSFDVAGPAQLESRSRSLRRKCAGPLLLEVCVRIACSGGVCQAVEKCPLGAPFVVEEPGDAGGHTLADLGATTTCAQRAHAYSGAMAASTTPSKTSECESRAVVCARCTCDVPLSRVPCQRDHGRPGAGGGVGAGNERGGERASERAAAAKQFEAAGCAAVTSWSTLALLLFV